jgi:hypothetical protein
MSCTTLCPSVLCCVSNSHWIPRLAVPPPPGCLPCCPPRLGMSHGPLAFSLVWGPCHLHKSLAETAFFQGGTMADSGLSLQDPALELSIRDHQKVDGPFPKWRGHNIYVPHGREVPCADCITSPPLEGS